MCLNVGYAQFCNQICTGRQTSGNNHAPGAPRVESQPGSEQTPPGAPPQPPSQLAPEQNRPGPSPQSVPEQTLFGPPSQSPDQPPPEQTLFGPPSQSPDQPPPEQTSHKAPPQPPSRTAPDQSTPGAPLQLPNLQPAPAKTRPGPSSQLEIFDPNSSQSPSQIIQQTIPPSLGPPMDGATADPSQTRPPPAQQELGSNNVNQPLLQETSSAGTSPQSPVSRPASPARIVTAFATDNIGDQSNPFSIDYAPIPNSSPLSSRVQPIFDSTVS